MAVNPDDRTGPGHGQSAVVAAFGRFALESRDAGVTIDGALDMLTDALAAPIGVLLRSVGPQRIEVLSARGDLGPPAGCELVTAEPLLAGSGGDPVVADGCKGVIRLPGADAVRSGVSVGVQVAGQLWRLAVLDTRVRRFGELDVGLVQSIGYLLAGALHRHRIESAQSAVTGFSRFALESRDAGTTVERAVNLVADFLDVPICMLVRVAGVQRLDVLHGRGPLGESLGGEVPAPAEILIRFRSPEPVVLGDWPVPADRRGGVADTPVVGPTADPAGGAGQRSCLAVEVLVAGERCRLAVIDFGPNLFGDTEIGFVQSVAHMLSAATERHRVEAQLREITTQLQHALLPAQVPRLPGIEAAARYVPAGDQVGGDWYDVLPLPHGGIGLVMGDVEGHDHVAAPMMGQVRNVLRAYAAEGHTPAEVLARVNEFVTAHGERMVTCGYAELHPAERLLICASAGHPAILRLDRDGRVGEVATVPGLVLGVEPDQDYPERTSVLPEGCCLLLATDGLIDHLGGAVYSGPAAIEAVAGPLVGEPLDVLADRLVTLAPGTRGLRDDAALLAVRITAPMPSGVPTARRVLASSAAAGPAARHFVADVLAGWGSPHPREAAVLAVSELITNAVVHSTGEIELVVRWVAPHRLWVGVHDPSDRMPRPRDASPAGLAPGGIDPQNLDAGGRGLDIVAHVVDAWGVTPTPARGGKTVWFELSVASAAYSCPIPT